MTAANVTARLEGPKAPCLLDDRLTKPEMARHIVESSGMGWNVDYESRGGTVTKAGLRAVLDAVDLFVGA